MNTESKTEPKRSQTNGLARWRQRMAEDKEQRMEELDRLRKGATTIIRDGKEYKVVIIPDKYAWGDS